MGNYQTKPSTDKQMSKNEEGKTLTWASSAMQGWRSSMEDADIAEDHFLPGYEGHSALFGVFDGHGGSEVSKCLNKYLAPALRRMIEQEKVPNYEVILQKLYLELDQAFSSPERLAQLDKELFPRAATEAGALGEAETAAAATTSQQPPSFPHIMTAGSTAVVVLLIDRTLYVANAGDSRAVLSRKGTAVHLTEDHKPNDPREMERITKAGWTVSGGRVGGTLNLSRALGDYEFKQNASLKPEEYSVTAYPDVRVEQLLDDQDEFFIIACDGIFEKMTWDTVVAFVRERLLHGLCLEKICSETLDECLAAIHGAPGCDNMTLQIVICPTTAGKELVQQGIEWSRTAPGPPEPETFEITTHKNSPFVSRKDSSDAILSDDHPSDDIMPPLVPIEPTGSHQSQESIDSSSDSDSASSSSSDSSSSDSSFSSDSSSDSSLVQDDIQIPSSQLTNSPFESADSQ